MANGLTGKDGRRDLAVSFQKDGKIQVSSYESGGEHFSITTEPATLVEWLPPVFREQLAEQCAALLDALNVAR